MSKGKDHYLGQRYQFWLGNRAASNHPQNLTDACDNGGNIQQASASIDNPHRLG